MAVLTGASGKRAETAAKQPDAGKPKRAKKYNKREAIAGYLFISPWIIGFLVFTLGAMLYSLFISFSNYNLATNSASPAWKTRRRPIRSAVEPARMSSEARTMR